MTIKSRDERPLRGPEIDLSGRDGNAFALMAFSKRWSRDLGIDHKPIIEDMMSGDYDHLLEVLETHFGEYVTFYR